MTAKKNMQQPRRAAILRAKFSALLILTLWSLFMLPLPGFGGQDSPAAGALKQKAQQAYINGRYGEAAALNLEIAGKHPESEAARYAVQMMGTIYENNIVDIRKAIKWDREYLERYADPRQASFYKEKIESLEKLIKQEDSFKTYQAIRFANKGDEAMVKEFEILLKEQPDFILKDKVMKELAYAYARLDKRRQSYLAFEGLSRDGGAELSESDMAAYATSSRYWHMTSAWAWVAWGVIVVLWSAALLMDPWKRLDRALIRTFLIWAAIWVLLTAIRMPTFYSLETDGDQFIFNASAVYLAAGLNLTVLLWLLLLTRGRFWQTRPRALRWFSPILTLLMTAAVFYLFIIHQPNGPQIMDAFAVKYRQWAGDLHPERPGSPPQEEK